MDQNNHRPGKWQAAKDWLDQAYDAHLKRYAGWDQQLYRICVRTVVSLAILVVLLPTIWLGWFGYRHFAEQHYAAQARMFLDRHDYRNAVLSARETFHFNPNNLAACRVMVQLSNRDHLPQVLGWQERVVTAEPTVDNKLELAALGLVYQKPPFPLTTKILTELAATSTNNARYQMAAADLAMAMKRLAEAEDHLETALQMDPTNQEYALNLALLRLGMYDEAKRAQSRSVLENMGTNETLGPAALRSLVKDRLSARDAAAAKRYSNELLAHHGATLGDQLQNLGILQRLKDVDFTNRLQSVQQSATNAETVGTVSDWMQSNGLITENLQWLTGLPARLQTRQPVQLALAQGYLKTENWRGLSDYAAQGNWGNLEYLRLALVSHALAKLGNSQVAKNNWDAAENEASHHLEALTKLYKFTEGLRMEPEEEDLLQHIVAEFPRENWASQALGGIYFSTSNTVAMNRLAAQLAGLFPTNTEYMNNQAATALLLRTNLADAGKLAADAYALNPGDPSVASTYAYALQIQGRGKEGLAVLQKLPPTRLKQPSTALYYGLLLAANGQTGEAAPYLQIAQTRGHLWPEEKQLLAEALKAAKPTPK